MSTAELMGRIEEASPRLRAKFVAAYYLLTVFTGTFILFSHGRMAFAADLLVCIFYIAATALLYTWSKPRHRGKRF
jgi:hypothetical protein